MAMAMEDTPILDDHLHLRPGVGRGLEAVEEFARSGGTHLLVVSNPSWFRGEVPRSADGFEPGFEATIETAERAGRLLRGEAYPVLGVHPALVSRLVDDHGVAVDEAVALMCAGLDRAAARVEAGRALALKSGRPHYPVDGAVEQASERVLKHAIRRAAEVDCALQLHTEATRDLSTVARWAREVGLDPGRVVKHYADGPVGGVVPSVIARREAIDRVLEDEGPFMLETDFLDDPDRPGAVLGPRTVPRRTEWLAERGLEEAIHRAHVETPAAVYGIDTRATLGDRP